MLQEKYKSLSRNHTVYECKWRTVLTKYTVLLKHTKITTNKPSQNNEDKKDSLSQYKYKYIWTSNSQQHIGDINASFNSKLHCT